MLLLPLPLLLLLVRLNLLVLFPGALPLASAGVGGFVDGQIHLNPCCDSFLHEHILEEKLGWRCVFPLFPCFSTCSHAFPIPSSRFIEAGGDARPRTGPAKRR
jgi:hypothetical protein